MKILRARCRLPRPELLVVSRVEWRFSVNTNESNKLALNYTSEKLCVVFFFLLCVCNGFFLGDMQYGYRWAGIIFSMAKIKIF